MSDEDNLLLDNNDNDQAVADSEDELAQLLDDNNNNDAGAGVAAPGGQSSSDDDDDDSSSDGGNQQQQDAAEGGNASEQGDEQTFGATNPEDDVVGQVDGEAAVLASMSKKEAKNSLSKKEYKKWKKVQKKLKKKSKKDKKKSSKSGKKATTSKSESSGSRKKKNNSSNNDQPSYDDDGGMIDMGGATTRMPRGGAAKRAAAGAAAATKLKKNEVPIEQLRDEAGLVVMSMTEARRKDEAARKNGTPPLHRLSIKEIVASAARKVILHEHLVASGMLDELTSWLANPQTKDLAPVDLRLIALHILDNLAFEGIEGGMKLPSRNKKPKIDKATGEMIEEDDLGYPGVSAEQLQATKLGWAVNFVRRHPQESAENRTTATRLLEKFSRVFRGGDEEERRASRHNRVLWSSQSDNTILPPFEVQPSVTQRFIEASTRADPNDPMSYLGVRRAYNKPSYVTGLGGDAAARAMAGAREPAANHRNIATANNSNKKRKTSEKKKKNTKASLDSDDDGSLLGSGDDDDDDGDLDDFLA